MEVAVIIASVRDVLQDLEDTPYRYSDGSLIRGLNMAVGDLRRGRPAYFIGGYDPPLPVISKTDEVLPLPDELMPAFIAYIAGWAETRDDEFTTDGRAAMLMKQ